MGAVLPFGNFAPTQSRDAADPRDLDAQQSLGVSEKHRCSAFVHFAPIFDHGLSVQASYDIVDG